MISKGSAPAASASAMANADADVLCINVGETTFAEGVTKAEVDGIAERNSAVPTRAAVDRTRDGVMVKKLLFYLGCVVVVVSARNNSSVVGAV